MSDFAFRSLPFSRKWRDRNRTQALPASPERFFSRNQRIAALGSVILGSVFLMLGALWQALPDFLSGAFVAIGAALVVGAILYALFVLPISASRQVYEFTLDHLPVGFYAARPDGTFNYVNRTLANMLGYDLPVLLSGAIRLNDLLEDEEGNAIDVQELLKTLDSARPARLYIALSNGDRLPVDVALSELGEPGAEQEFTHTVVSDVQNESRWRETLEAESERFDRLFKYAPIAMAIVDRAGRTVESNAAFNAILGGGSAAIKGKALLESIHEGDAAAVQDAIEKARQGYAISSPLDVRVMGQEQRDVQMLASPVDLADGSQGAILFMVDTTERRRLEHQFTQSQRLHAVAQLAGGIAHDFNNLLTAISGFADLLLERHALKDDPSHSEIVQIKQSAERAAGLVAQLLAFSRQQMLKPERINIGAVIGGLEELIGRMIGDQNTLKIEIDRDLRPIKADKGQLEQVLINLCVNARDAMPKGGTVSIQAGNISAAAVESLNYSALPAADYVVIEVADSGSGIPPDILNKVFEPFFTTKEVGEGTGLGLSMVYGIVKQSGGYIFADNKPEGGAAFRIFLPVAEAAQGALPASADGPDAAGETQDSATILLVEDEEVVRHFAARAMREKGYNVLEASDGLEALEILDAHGQSITLMITDVVMPNLDGASLAKKVRERGDGMKIVYMSGYAQETYREKIDLTTADFLEKPFTLKDLTETVEEVLERRESA